MKKMLMRLCLLIISGSAALSAQATVTCKFYNDSTLNTTASLSGSAVLSVTPDIPVGSILYVSHVSADKYPDTFSLDCIGGPGERYSASIHGKVLNSSKLGDNITFDSGYPGIGVRFRVNSDWITADGKRVVDSFDKILESTGHHLTGRNSTDRAIVIYLVKTGNVQPGVLSAEKFPYVQYNWKAGDNTILPTGVFSEFHFNGQLSITSPSCKTPDNVDVDLGEYTTNQINNNGGSPWKDASIRLSGCPRFTGFNRGVEGRMYITQAGKSSVSYATGGDVPVYGANRLGLTLNGVRGNLDIANGIVDIDHSAGSASGVAVQIAKGDTGSNTPAQLSAEIFQNIPMDGSSTLTIPLVVRMIKHGESAVKAGRVNTQITYLINYK